MKFLKTAIILIAVKSQLLAQASLQLDAKSWVEDIDYLVKNVADLVPNFNSRINPSEFNSQVEELKQNIDSKSLEELVWGMQNLLNLIEDDGCNVMPFQTVLKPRLLPIKSYWFSDGLFICDASEKYKSLKGERIIKINNIEIDELFNSISTSLNADNEYYRKHLFPLYINLPSLFKSYGISDSNDMIELEFASGKTAAVIAEEVSEYRKLERELPNDGVFSLTNTSHKGDYYWFEYLPNSKTLYVQLQWIYNKEDDISFNAFVENIEHEIKEGKAAKVLIDVRYGGGGNGFKFKGLTDLLRDSESINKNGNLFVLTSRATSGALLELASVLSLNTKAILVGEPTGEGPNTVGDTKQITLPNSGLTISLTKVFWPTSWDGDKRKTIAPDLHVTYSFKDHHAKLDPWIEAVIGYSQTLVPKPISDNLAKSLVGDYKINGRKISVKENKGELYLSMKRPIKSFFEIRTELYFEETGLLKTDIEGVFVNYLNNENDKLTITGLNWKGSTLIAQ